MEKVSSIFQSVEKSRLSTEIARQIEQAIREERYLPGEVLPSERELTKIFKVSRPILREALRILEIQGFVSIQQGRGTFVKDPKSDIINIPLKSWVGKNMHFVQEFYEARLAIEPVCAALAAERATPKQIMGLREIVLKGENLVGSEEAASYVPLDIDFHTEVACLSGNRYLIMMLKTLIIPETDVRKVILRLPNHIAIAHLGHMAVLEAIEARNPEAARQAMVAALNQPFQAIDQYLREEEEDS